MQTIIGQFGSVPRAHAAIDALFERKYDKADISYLANDGFGEVALSEGRPSSATSGVLALLAGVGTVTIPGVRPVLAAGPHAVAFAGTADGTAEDGTVWPNALAKFGVPDHQANVYGEAVRAGGALVLVRGTEALVDNIEAILASHGPVSIHSYLSDWEA
jgi:hypothetical protein